MDVNQPDRGIFKGMNTQSSNATQRKNFAHISNQHQIVLSHGHDSNQYLTSTNSNPANMPSLSFATVSKLQFTAHQVQPYRKAQPSRAKNNNVHLGDDKPSFKTNTQQNFVAHPQARRLESIKRKEQQLILGTDKSDYKTTKQFYAEKRTVDPKQDIKYKVEMVRYDPIRGVQRDIEKAGNYEFFNPLKQKGCVANNHTVVPRVGENFDIITGRKIPY